MTIENLAGNTWIRMSPLSFEKHKKSWTDASHIKSGPPGDGKYAWVLADEHNIKVAEVAGIISKAEAEDARDRLKAGSQKKI